MKKLEKLKLHDFDKISADDQKSIKGGDGYWITAEDGNQYYYVGDIQIIAQQEPVEGWGAVCPACEEFRNHNENNSLGGVDGENVLTPAGEFIFNTIPHLLGFGDHINGSETYYIINMAYGETIYGSN